MIHVKYSKDTYVHLVPILIIFSPVVVKFTMHNELFSKAGSKWTVIRYNT